MLASLSQAPEQTAIFMQCIYKRLERVAIYGAR